MGIGYLLSCPIEKDNKKEDINIKNNIISYSNNEQQNENEILKGIRKRKNGLYEIRKMVNGVRNSYYANTKLEAKKIIKSLNKGFLPIKKIKEEEEVKTLTLKEWIIEWRETYKKPFVKKQTYRNIILHTDTIIKSLGKIPLNELSADIIQKFLNKFEKTRRKELITLYFGALIKFAYDKDLINKNYFNTVIKEKKIKSNRIGYNYYEQVEILKIIKNTQIEEEILFYLLSGCRLNELPNKENFDFDNNFVEINGTKSTTSLRRILELTPEYSQRLKKYFENNNFLSSDRIVKVFRQLMKDNNFKNANIHKLRHTFANNQYTLGTDIKQIQYWLGHSSINMTLDIYTNIDKTLTKDRILTLYNNYYYIKK